MAHVPSHLRPPPLLVYRTCIWKIVGEVSILLDIFLPSINDGSRHPIMLFIHGGGWIASNRTDYSRPLFHQFLLLGFLIVSMDYRLLPETTFGVQLQDVRDMELWLKNKLSSELEESFFTADTDNIVIAGCSAGALLALLTPKLWSTPPTAILSMYGPTDMHRVPYLRRGRLSQYDAPSCSPEILAAATNYACPPTNTGCPPTSIGFSSPRSMINLKMFQEGITAEFLLKGLVRNDDGSLRMPDKGCATRAEIDEISPLHLCQKIKYPPTYQVIGTIDDIFDTYHINDFHAALSAQGIRCEKILVPDKGHAFDIYEKIDGEVHIRIIKPAVEWIVNVTSSGGGRAAQSVVFETEMVICRCCI